MKTRQLVEELLDYHALAKRARVAVAPMPATGGPVQPAHAMPFVPGPRRRPTPTYARAINQNPPIPVQRPKVPGIDIARDEGIVFPREGAVNFNPAPKAAVPQEVAEGVTVRGKPMVVEGRKKLINATEGKAVLRPRAEPIEVSSTIGENRAAQAIRASRGAAPATGAGGAANPVGLKDTVKNMWSKASPTLKGGLTVGGAALGAYGLYRMLKPKQQRPAAY
jgi:hypothetical protein